MSNRVTVLSLLGALLVTVAAPGVGAQEAREVAFASPRPHFVAAGAPERPVEVHTAVALNRRVSLELVGVPVADAIEELSRQADLQISYSSAALPEGKLVTIRAQDIAVATGLTEMLLASELDVVVDRGGQLALVPCRHPVVHAEVQDTGAIVGRVTDKATGDPIAGAVLAVEGTGKSGTTGGDGRFRIEGLEAETYTVRARYIGYAPLAAMVTVTAGVDVEVAFALEKSVQALDELVTVTPGGGQTEVRALPSPVTVVTADVIEAQAPRNVQELLRQAVPGAVSWDQTGRPASAAFSVRGAATLNPGSTQMKVIIDGIQVADPLFNIIDPQSIERIEVIRGPQAAAIYGSDAIGGVLQIFTKRGEARTRPTVQGEVSYGLVQTGYDSPEGAVRQSYSGSVLGGTSDVTYNLGASYWRNGDWVPPVGELSRQSSPSLFGGVRYARGIIDLDLSAQYGEVSAGTALDPEFLTTGLVALSKPSFGEQATTSTNVGARLSVTPLSWWVHSVQLGLSDTEFLVESRQPRYTTPGDSLLQVISSETSRRWIGYTSTVEFQASARVSGSLTAGFDHNDLPAQSLNTLSASPQSPLLPSAFAYRINTTNTGYFLQGQFALDDAFYLSGGIRAEQNTNFGDSLGTPISPRVGLSYVRPLGGVTLKLRGSWGRAIRAPDPGLKLSFGPDVRPNPLLAPERQRGWDAGVDVQLGARGSLGLTYYDQTAENLIQYVPLPSPSGLMNQFQNVGRVKNRGIEVEAGFRAGWLDARVTYAYGRARIEDLGANYSGDLVLGEQVRGTPKHTVGALLAATPRPGTAITAGLAYVGGFSAMDLLALFRCFGGTGPCTPNFQFVTEHSGFAKLNIGVTQRLFGGLSALLRVDNLTNNTSAVEFGRALPVMGRITTVGLRFGT